MKHLRYLLILILFTACSIPIEPVKNPDELTNLKILNLPSDTVVLSIDNDADMAYILKDGKVQYKFVNYNIDYPQIHIGIVLIAVVVLVILGVLIAAIKS
jgi:hypothetical protein